MNHINALPARNGTEGLSSLPTNPGCGKRSEDEVFLKKGNAEQWRMLSITDNNFFKTCR